MSALTLPVGLVVVSSDRLQIGDPLAHVRQHFPDATEVGEDVTFALLVEDPLAVHEHFHDALTARGDRYRSVGTEMPKELVGHPRGRTEVLSTNAVGDLDLDFAFHVNPPRI